MFLQRANSQQKSTMRMAHALCNEECFAALVAERQPKMAACTASEGHSPSLDFEKGETNEQPTA
jgi:hypothetical protein